MKCVYVIDNENKFKHRKKLSRIAQQNILVLGCYIKVKLKQLLLVYKE